jgi:hypothetical protein
MSGSVTIHNSESVRVYDWGTLRKNEIKQWKKYNNLKIVDD